MKLKERLMTSFIITMLLPIILIVLAGFCIMHMQNTSLQKNYDLTNGAAQLLQSPIRIFDRATKEVYEEVQKTAGENPSLFEDRNYLNQINEELRERTSFLLIRRESSIVYEGSGDGIIPQEGQLPDYGDDESNYTGAFYVGGAEGKAFLLKQQDFKYTDGAKGSVFLVTDISTLLPQTKSFILQIVLALVLVLCVTAALLTYWTYQAMFRPLNELRRATNELQQGNLNYSIQAKSKDEIGLLCEDFEKMRIRLKDMIERQIQYEEDTIELVSNISHDLKTPLTAIKGYTEGLIDGIADTPERREKYLRTIYTKANDMTHLVEELADFTKIESDAMVYNFTEVNVDQFFFDCINEISLDLEVKNIGVGYFNYTNKETLVIADREQLKRVLNNIIGNSLKYMDKPKGILNVRITDEKEYVKVSIEDNGKGIAKSDQRQVFERFYRTDASRNSAKGGSGLGLSIAKKIIDDHGGSIYADGEEGVGTTITFLLRKVQKEKEGPPAGQELAPRPKDPGRKILRMPSNPFWNHLKK